MGLVQGRDAGKMLSPWETSGINHGHLPNTAPLRISTPESVIPSLLPPIMSPEKPHLEAEKGAPDFSSASGTSLCPLCGLEPNVVAFNVWREPSQDPLVGPTLSLQG